MLLQTKGTFTRSVHISAGTQVRNVHGYQAYLSILLPGDDERDPLRITHIAIAGWCRTSKEKEKER
jgi:hypothetical protein